MKDGRKKFGSAEPAVAPRRPPGDSPPPREVAAIASAATSLKGNLRARHAITPPVDLAERSRPGCARIHSRSSNKERTYWKARAPRLNVTVSPLAVAKRINVPDTVTTESSPSAVGSL